VKTVSRLEVLFAAARQAIEILAPGSEPVLQNDLILQALTLMEIAEV